MMNGDARFSSRAFAVSFQNLKTWSVAAQFAIAWNWPHEIIKPLGSILSRRSEAAPTELNPDTWVTLLTIHFDGSIEPREPVQIKDIKGKLFRAYPRDVVFSKIDVRNGAIGLAPDNIDLMCVTSEFPIYYVNTKKALPAYVKLLFRTSSFKKLLNSMISGTSGRKRIQPSQLEDLKVPFPPLHIQQKIVAYWERAQKEILFANRTIEEIQTESETELLNKIGLKVPHVSQQKGHFVIHLSQNERWDTFFFRKDFLLLDEQIKLMNHISLGDALNFISRSWKPADFENGEFEYIEISSVSKKDGVTSTKTVKINEAPSRATTLVKTGDLIISTTRPYLGAFAIVGKRYEKCVCSSGFALADSVKTDKINKEFILFYLKSPAGLRQLERRMSGGLYPAIIQSELEKILIPLPPLEIQNDIVAADKKRCTDIKKLDNEKIKIRAEVTEKIEKLLIGTLPVEEL